MARAAYARSFVVEITFHIRHTISPCRQKPRYFIELLAAPVIDTPRPFDVIKAPLIYGRYMLRYMLPLMRH